MWTISSAKSEREFVPVDLQESMCKNMNNMSERNLKDLPDYVRKFCPVVTQLREISELDQIICFPQRLAGRTREEDKNGAIQRCTKLLLLRWALTALIHCDIPKKRAR